MPPQLPYAQQPQYDPGMVEQEELARQTLSGKFLDEGNPYLDQVIQNANRDVAQGLEGQLANLSRASLRPGMIGSSVWSNQRQGLQDAAAQRMADASTGARAQAYEAERGRQQEVLGLQGQRDQAVWGDVTNRRGQDVQADIAAKQVAAQRAAAASARASAGRNAQLAARAQEAQIRSNLLLGQGDLAERARQFDMQHGGSPLQWAQMLGNQIEGFGQQEQGDLGLLSGLIGQQMGGQQNAANLMANLGTAGAGLDLEGIGQQIGAAGMLPGFDAAANAPMGMAGDYLASLFGSQSGLDAARAGASASRSNAAMADQLARDQLQYGSVRDQWGYNDPQGALQDFLGPMGLIGGMAGGTTTGSGTGAASPGAVVPGQQSGLASSAQTLLPLLIMSGAI